MDENTYNIVKEVHEHLSSVQDFTSDQAKLIMAGEIAKLRTLLMFFGGVENPSLEDSRAAKIFKWLGGGK